MAQLTHDEQMQAYTEAVQSGLYAKKSGLVGKYDNVRLYWEDEITRQFLYPHLKRLIDRSRQHARRVRIMDLGCGSADGYELLTGIREPAPKLSAEYVQLLTPDVLGLYKGVDLNQDLLDQARAIYGENDKLCLEIGNFADGLPLGENEKPYDLYFTSYGTCSHNNEDETLVSLLADIARRCEEYCVIVCDWLGRYSIEWQTLWTNDLSENRNMDYVVSYIYEKEERERKRDQLQHLLLRLMSRPEAEEIIRRASEQAGVEIRPLQFFDRSVFTGRHMDTADYNPHAQPLRRAVNSLHEDNYRTELQSLIIDYVPRTGFDFLNDYYSRIQMCWNMLVQYVAKLLEAYDLQTGRFTEEIPAIHPTYPRPLREMMERMRLVVEGIGWLRRGLPRENIIEPQLGYALQYLVTEMQQGVGGGHGFVGILEVDKT